MFTPFTVLCHGQRFAPAGRTHILIMVAVRKLIMDTQRLLDIFQIVNMQPRRKRLTAAQAFCLFSPRAFFLIKLNADLRWPLENVKELSKRQIEQGEDDRYGMQHRQKPVIQAMQQMG